MILLIAPANLLAQASLIDSSFNIGSGANGTVYSIVVQNDGKILVGGEFTQIAGQNRANLARLDSDGQLDPTFPEGTDGAVYQLLKQPDGKFLVGGAFANIQGVARQRIGRLLTNGVVDSSFDATTNIPAESAVSSLATQADGKILVTTFLPTNYTIGFLKRFEPTGQSDLSFVQTNIFEGSYVFAACPRTNGSILLGGGFQGVNGFSTPGLALLSTNGQLDSNFISPLKTNSSSFDYSVIYAMTELPDNSFLIGGRFWKQGSTNRSTVGKLTPTLSLDASVQPDDFDPNVDHPSIGTVMSMIRQLDGKFVLGGLFQTVGGYWRRNIVRVDSQGKVDPCFDPGVGLGDYGQLGVMALAQQVDGKILAGGNFICFSGSPVESLSSSNITRFLPQSDCNATRLHLGRYGHGQDFVAATCAPGGTNLLQSSTNLMDWITIDQPPPYPLSTFSSPYLYLDVPNISTLEGGLFFRVKKEY